MDSIKRKSFNANVDLIHGPIFKSLIIFALPLFISNIFQQLYNTVDTMIVGNFLGDASLAAIGSMHNLFSELQLNRITHKRNQAKTVIIKMAIVKE